MAIFMNYNKLGIKGNVTAKGYEDWIDISSMQFGVGRAITMDVGNMSNREASRPSLSEVTITKTMDCASGPMLGQSVTGDSGVEVVIAVVATGAKQVEEFCKYTLQDVLVSSYSISAAGDSAPSESLSFSFSDIMCEVTGADKTNKNGKNIKVGYNLVTAEPK